MGFEKICPPVDKEQGRKEIILLLNQLLVLANQDEDLKPHMQAYPVTHSNIDLTVYYIDPDGYNGTFPHLTYVASHNNELVYTAFDADYKKVQLKE